MKPIAFLSFIILILGTVSCTQDMDGSIEPQGSEPEVILQEVILNAYAADATPDTKTSISFTDNTHWQQPWSTNEHISLFYGTGENGGSDFVSINTEPTIQTQFRGSIEVITGFSDSDQNLKFWGIYPYDQGNACQATSVSTFIHSTQIAALNTWADNETLTVGRADGLYMGFYNVCGFVRIFLEPVLGENNQEDPIVRIDLSGNDNQNIAGKIKVVIGNDGKPAIDEFLEGSKTIKLLPPDGYSYFPTSTVNSQHQSSNPTRYYISLAPTDFTTGFTFKFYTQSGKLLTRTFSSRQNITRSNYQGWGTAANRSDMVTVGDVPPQNNQIAYYATAKLENNAFLASGATEHVYDQSTHRGVVTFSADVTEIDYNAFNGETALTGIVLPETVESIGNYAFKGCTNLAFVKVGAGNDMGSTITFIGEEAFYGCSSLTGVTLPTSLLYLRQLAFGECTALTGEMVIPASLDNCYTNPFYKCTGITSFSGRYATDDGLFLFDTSSNVLLSSALGAEALATGTSCTIPAGTGIIFPYALAGLKSESIDLGNTVYDLREGCLEDASGLTGRITVPSTVTRIRADAFKGCTGLATLEFLNDNLPDIDALAFGTNGYQNGSSTGATPTATFDIYIPGWAAASASANKLSGANWNAYRRGEQNRIYVCPDFDELWYHGGNVNNASVILDYNGDGFTGTAQFWNNYKILPYMSMSQSVRDAWNSSTATSMNVMKFNDNVDVIGDQAFRNSSVDFVLMDLPITSIGDHAFAGCSNMGGKLSLGSLQSLGEYAFYGCSSLEKVYSLQAEVISNNAFGGCSGLTEVVFLEGVKYIDFDAFYGCSSLTTINLPSSIQGVGRLANTSQSYNPFRGCTSLTSFSVASGNSPITTWDNGKFLLCNGGQFLISCALGGFSGSTCFIPNGVTEIGHMACSGANFKELTLPSSLTTIGNWSFSNCVDLDDTRQVTIPASVTSIGQDAFSGCTHIKLMWFEGDNLPTLYANALGGLNNDGATFPIYIPGYATSASYQALGGNSPWYTYREGSNNTSRLYVYQDNDEIWYYGTQEQTFIPHPETILDENGSAAGNDCVIPSPNYLNFKPQVAFPNPSSIPNIYMRHYGADVKTIGDNAFFNINLNTSNPIVANYSYLYISIPRTVTTVGNSAFQNNGSLQVYPMNRYATGSILTSIGNAAFANCYVMVDPKSNAIRAENVTSLGESAFSNCSSIQGIILGELNGPIPNHAFSSCHALEFVWFNGGVSHITAVYGGAFQNCENLQEVGPSGRSGTGVYLPNMTGYVGEIAFCNCTSLTVANLGAVTSFSSKAFSGCSALTTVTITPSAVTAVGDEAFHRCFNLTTVADASHPNSVQLPNATSIGMEAFANTSIGAVSIGSGTATPPTLGLSAFAACTHLTTANLPGVTAIPHSCFYNCTSLNYVNGASIQTIDDDAFNHCESLTTLELPGIVSIGNKAFAFTRSLTTLKLGPNLFSLGDSLFYDNVANARNRGNLDLYLYSTNATFWNDADMYTTFFDSFLYGENNVNNPEYFIFHRVFVPADQLNMVTTTYQNTFFDLSISNSGWYQISGTI